MATRSTSRSRNRTLRAVVAAGLGLLLLAGVGGTFARWFDSQSVSTGDIASGELTLSEPTD